MIPNKPIDVIRTKIWLTSKTRMQAEKRYATYDLVLNLVLCLYSTILIGITVFADNINPNVPVAAYTIILSVAIVVSSALIFGFGYGKVSVLHRECYLRLEKLYSSKLDDEQIENMYHEVLAAYPNHSPIDYDRLILNYTGYNSKILKDSSGANLSSNFYMFFRSMLRHILFWLTPIAILVTLIYSMLFFGGL